MDDESADSIDFKPFFDMVVGVLFILLILVAAQMFFAQWRPVTNTPTAEEVERLRREELDREIQQFLGRLEVRLRAVDLPASVDRVGRAVTLPAAPLRQNGMGWSQTALNAVGGALRAELSCLDQGLAPEAGCPPYRQLRLARLEPILSLASVGDGVTPSPETRIDALEFSAALFRQSPALLALRTPAGGPAIDTGARINPLQQGAAGRLDLRFAFSELP